jgi:NTP pyrophosphatase (non-canonical NTP hydrolase)
VINLLEEVGELANAVLVESGDKPEKRRRAQLRDSFADILFALSATADAFEVDLEKELLKTLKEIEDRQNKKEYEDK